jgi:hypothetical protein
MGLAFVVGFWAFFAGIWLGIREGERQADRRAEDRLAFKKREWEAEQSLAQR